MENWKLIRILKKRDVLLLFLLLCSFNIWAQNLTVGGKVTDKNNEPIIGATVVVEGNTSLGTVTDMDGNYTLANVRSNANLVFRYVGMKTEVVPVRGNSVINVTLSEESEMLSEVVVTALGIRKEVRSLGYSMQAIKGDELIQANTPNLISSLAGKMSGVNINMSNQLEGGSTRIVIRGNNSITGNNQPLFVIDGMPIESTARTAGKAGQGEGENMTDASQDFGTGINMINQNDIESIDVLKGPAAAALYGARGANGVVMITTKKGGKKQGIGIDLSYSIKGTNPYRFQDKQNKYGMGGFGMAQRTADQSKMYRTDPNFGMLMPYSDWDGAAYSSVYDVLPYTGGLWDFSEKAFSWHGYGTSWGPEMTGQKLRLKGPDGSYATGETYINDPQPNNQKEVYRTGTTENYNLAFSNGGNWGSFRVGLGNISNKAIIPNSGYKQTNVTVGANLNISDQLTASVSASYTDFNRHNFNVNPDGDSYTKWSYNFPTSFNTAFWRDRYKNADNSKANGSINPFGPNPLDMFWRMYEQNTHQYNNKLTSSVALTYSPTDFLDIMGRVGLDYNNLEVEQKNNPTNSLGTVGGFYSHRMGKDKVEDFSAMATLHKQNIFYNKLNARFSLGTESWSRYMYEMWANNDRPWANPYIWSFKNYNLQGNNEDMKFLLPDEIRIRKKINSVFGNLEMDYDNFLYLQITGRNDWSSTLPLSNNSYFYPSVNMGFVFNQFLSNWKWLSFAKIRTAYAMSANDTDPYQLMPTFEGGNFAGNPTHSVRADLPPVNLKPQYANTFDVGFNLKFLENRFKVDFTYYNTRSFNQIMSAPLPISSGYSSYKFNTGELQNRGVELELGADIIRKTDFDWNMTLNMARNNNKLIALDGETKMLFVGQIFGATNGPTMRVTVGEKYGGIYGWDYERDKNGNKIVNLVYGEGEYAKKVVGTTYKTTKEQVLLGNATPDFTGGLNSRLRFKGVTIYALADFSYGGDIWSGDFASAYQTGVSPQTLFERDGGGLPYTYGDGTKANHGVIMDGVLEDGTKNTYVVHYTWKYGRTGSWGGNASRNQLTTPSILRNNWIKMREITLSWQLPTRWLQKTKAFQSVNINLTGRDLFYIYSSLPEHLNPEATSMQTGNAQGMMFGALPGVRSVTVGVNVTF